MCGLAPITYLQSSIIGRYPRYISQDAGSTNSTAAANAAASAGRREFREIPRNPRSAIETPSEFRCSRFGVDL